MVRRARQLDETDTDARPKPRATFIGALVVLVIVAAFVVHRSGRGDHATPHLAASNQAQADLEFSIPAGTGQRIDAGERIDILPDRLEVHVGDVIRIRNDDERGHVIGPFYVGALETMTQKFTSTGTWTGYCAVHPEGQITLTVLPQRIDSIAAS